MLAPPGPLLFDTGRGEGRRESASPRGGQAARPHAGFCSGPARRLTGEKAAHGDRSMRKVSDRSQVACASPNGGLG